MEKYVTPKMDIVSLETENILVTSATCARYCMRQDGEDINLGGD